VLSGVRSLVDSLVTVLSRCGAFSGRSERSLFAQGHVKMISFFRTRDISAFHLCECRFPGTFLSDLSCFCVKLRRVHDLSFSKLLAAKIFDQFSAEKNSIIAFFRGQRLYFLVLSLQQAWNCYFFALID